MMVMSAGLLGRAPDVSGRVQGNQSSNVAQSGSKLTAGCSPATAITYLELNNVRCRIDGTKGGMWMERATSTSGYEVPKGSGSFSIFAGALWMGGLDVNGQLKLAAFTYGQGGNDFWPGPLNVYTAEIDAATCAKWDKYFYITRDEVDQFVAWWNSGKTDPANYTIPQSILNYPAHGDVSLGQDYYLAPFYDVDGDGQYDPEGSGDYPYYDLKGEIDCRKVRDPRLFGDVTFWWIFNDKGNVHTETNGPSIGMEIRGQAFAFATNDEVNNMTFYNYALINRSTFTLTNTFFGQWADTDLGYSDDDYVGCDVQRGLGYAYNGDAFDEDGNGVKGYGNQPPAIGIDFFEGPYQDNDGMDNPLTTNVQLALSQGGIPYKGLGLGYGDGIVDNERMGMFFVQLLQPRRWSTRRPQLCPGILQLHAGILERQLTIHLWGQRQRRDDTCHAHVSGQQRSCALVDQRRRSGIFVDGADSRQHTRRQAVYSIGRTVHLATGSRKRHHGRSGMGASVERRAVCIGREATCSRRQSPKFV